jgi:dynein heavy chain 2
MNLLLFCEEVDKDISEFSKLLPLIKGLRSEAIKDKHWAEIMQIANTTINHTEEFTLQDLVAGNLWAHEHAEQIALIRSTAEKEFALRTALSDMKGKWGYLEFKLRPHLCGATLTSANKTETIVDVLVDTEDLLDELDDQSLKTQSLLWSPSIGAMKSEALEWDELLRRCKQILEIWQNVQKLWLYLEPIFRRYNKYQH